MSMWDMTRSCNRWMIDDHAPLGVRTWRIMGRFPWWVRREWLERHHRLTAIIDGTYTPTP